MSSAPILGAAAAVAILALPALAFGQAQAPMSGPGVDTATPMSTPSAGMPNTPTAQAAGVDTNGTVVDSSQAPPGQIQALKAGDNSMVTNGPVPDTAANRAKYGRPMSHAGKKTPPAGN
ncbi:MAG: hypothetical protein M3T55_13525 [Pseudomonadota bacterium]|nr:hypothetical protein [Pseudomonadota bacterium]